jgi:hypothetical protein
LLDYEIATGDHEVVIRAEGRAPFRTSITVGPETSHQVTAQLGSGSSVAAAGGSGATPEGGVYTPARELGLDRSGPRFTRSAIPLPPWSIAFDASWGWPYLIGAYRLGLGVWDGLRVARIDVAIEGRSSYYVTEFDARARMGFRLARIVGLGFELSLGGGFGAGYDDNPGRRSEFVFGMMLYEGLELGRVAFALTQRLEVFSDKYAVSGEPELRTQSGARVFVGLTFEVRIIRMLHLWVTGDYAPLQSSRRVMCGGIWAWTSERCGEDVSNHAEHWMHDINLNVQAGLGLRFR